MNDSSNSTRTARLTIDMLDADVLALTTELRETQRDCDTYRELLQLALAQLNAATERARVLARRLRQLTDAARSVQHQRRAA